MRHIKGIMLLLVLTAGGVARGEQEGTQKPTTRANVPVSSTQETVKAAVEKLTSPTESSSAVESMMRKQLATSGPTLILFSLASLVPAAVLMVTAFVRIQIVLTLLRQALGSPQIPGNQVLGALAILLTALVMQPVGQRVYDRGLKPYADGRMSVENAWQESTGPIKTFMIDQVIHTKHQDYLWQLHDYTKTSSTPDPTEFDQFPLQIVAPAYLLSELTTALTIGFMIYLPFLVIDLVVSAVLAAMGLFMLPPSLVALPIKLILFVLADGWMLVAGMLLRSFGG